MRKCPKHKLDRAILRAKVEVCPKCGAILHAEELFRLLREAGIDGGLEERLEEKIKAKNVRLLV